MQETEGKINVRQANRKKISWLLVTYDLLVFAGVELFFLVHHFESSAMDNWTFVIQFFVTVVIIFAARFIGSVYNQVWRYATVQNYIRIIIVDTLATFGYFLLSRLCPFFHIPSDRLIAICTTNLLISLLMRTVYCYACKYATTETKAGKFWQWLLYVFAHARLVDIKRVNNQEASTNHPLNIAIIGVDNLGISLAQELINTSSRVYLPVCFVDVSTSYAGRYILGVPVLANDKLLTQRLRDYEVQEVVFAASGQTEAERKELYERFITAGFKIKVYDYPTLYNANGKRQLREFDVEELLFRNQVAISNDFTNAYYAGKTILVTGGGGSIGSELCRQLAKMNPKRIVILDIYENGAYDVQQELKQIYKDKLDLQVEIASVTTRAALERVFKTHQPDVVVHAAAHKHVPLMEHNCVEAVHNNVFGTKNLVDMCEKFGTARFIMVSTDKAVNPTNVMGATKRMCEMIVLSASRRGMTVYSATRFGNVLGSAGSVIPLFKKQIAAGGPITITDKRIIRYFMTISEASQLVLESGAIAKNGELFVLDMKQPVKILDLAENMIRLSGAHDIEIIETGLRPGEKLYEELLIRPDELDKTENELIFIERDDPLPEDEIDFKLEILKKACESGSDELAREALHLTVPTFRNPEEVNEEASSGKYLTTRFTKVSAASDNQVPISG